MGKSTLKAKFPGWKTLGTISGSTIGTAVSKTFNIDYDTYSELVCTAQLMTIPKMPIGTDYGQGTRGYFSDNYNSEFLLTYRFNSDSIYISANRTRKGNLDSASWELTWLYR